MTIDHRTTIDLPPWIRDPMEGGETLDDLLKKRGGPRQHTSLMCHVQFVDRPAGESMTVRVTNISRQGAGFIARRHLSGGLRIRLRPSDDPSAAAILARIVHCTGTVQGYKVGCAFVDVEDATPAIEANDTPAIGANDAPAHPLKGKRAMTLWDWLAASNPPGIWVDLGSRESPDRFPGFPGMRYDRNADIWWLPARDGTSVPALMRPHPLIREVENNNS